MDYVIVAFRSRTHTIRFAEALRAKGVPADIINTPREAYVGCGLSAKISKRYLPGVRRLAYSSEYNSFAGIFAPVYVGGKLTMKNV